MGKGISIYMGLNYSFEDNIIYIKTAREKGFDRMFTSLHIPEANYAIIINEFTGIIREAKALGMEVIADISPKGFEYLNIQQNDLKKVKEFGIDVLRIDYGFSAEAIARFTKNECGLKIEINGSTVTEKFLKELENYGPCFENMQACHNFYPRMNTGISIDSLLRKNSMLKKFGMDISAFIPSLINKRPPIQEGLPTLEIHRFLKPEISAKHLYALGLDNVFFGDSIPSDQEIYEVGSVPENIIELKVKPMVSDNISMDMLNYGSYTNRSDGAEDLVRAVESRMCMNSCVIKPGHTTYRKKGSITVDNEGYLRYVGELQICRRDLQEDSRVNVIGMVIEEELFLLDYIKDESKFRFKII